MRDEDRTRTFEVVQCCHNTRINAGLQANAGI